MTDRLSRLRNDDAYRACVAVLDEAGIPYDVEWGTKHPRLVFEFRQSDNRRPKKAAADIRRMLRDAERRRPKKAPEQASVFQAEPAPAPSRDQQRTRTMDATTAAAGESNAVLDIGLHPIDGEPRVRDVELAERLGFERPLDIRELIRRNDLELRSFGSFPFRTEKSGGRPGVAFFLNEEQSLLVAILSRAPRAKEVRAMLIRVFTAWRRGQLTPPNESRGETPAEEIAMFGGVAKAVIRKAIADEVAPVLADLKAADELILDRLAALGTSPALPPSDRNASDDMVTAFEIVASMADVPESKRYSGLAGQISALVARFCMRHGYQARTIDLRPGEKLIFPRRAALEWLSDGGRKEVWLRVNAHAAKRAGQGMLKLVAAPAG
jgi:hypothetical protein